jgi:hypothetical protein
VGTASGAGKDGGLAGEVNPPLYIEDMLVVGWSMAWQAAAALPREPARAPGASHGDTPASRRSFTLTQPS